MSNAPTSGHRHSLLDLDVVARASDWLNPILVKETRQALKSRQFVATFFLVLIASWLISVFGIVFAGPGAEYRPIGGGFFFAYYVALAFAIFIFVPFFAFRSLLNERDLHTWEVLSITTLKPRQIVWGKLGSAVVQLFIFYSAITPFIAFANLLKGIDVLTITFVLVGSMVWSLALSMVALMAGTLATQKSWQVLLTLAVLGGLVFGLSSALSMVSYAMSFGSSFDDPGFWWAVGVTASYIAAFCVLSLQIAVAQLTFDADNRTTGIRLACAGIFWLTLAWTTVVTLLAGKAGLGPAPPRIEELLTVMSVFAAGFWAVVGLFAVTESDVLSRRVRRNFERWGALRLLAAPFLPGGSRGLVYVLVHVSALSAYVFGMSVLVGSSDIKFWRFAAALWCYLVFYLGLGSALGRLARTISGEFRPPHARVLTVLSVALGAIIPHAISLFTSIRSIGFWRSHPLLFVTDPFSTLTSLVDNNIDSNTIVFVLGAMAIISLLINVRAMLAGIADVARPYIPVTPALPRDVAAAPVTAEAWLS